MDEQIVDLLRDQFKTMNDKIDSLHEDVRSHVQKDERYWGKIDEQQAQIGVIRWLGSGVSGSALLAWLYSKFGTH